MQVYSHLLPRAQTLAACGDPQGQPRAVEENSRALSLWTGSAAHVHEGT